MSTGIDGYRDALRTLCDTVRRVRPEQWDNPSPCPGWTAHDVVEHVIGAQRSLLAMLGEESAAREWDEIEAEVVGALLDPDLANRTIATPMGDLDGSDLLDMSVVEPLVHGWDLARALGEDPSLDEEAAARCLDIARRYEAVLRGPGMYGPARDDAGAASAGQALLAFLGRDAAPSYRSS